MEKNWTTQWNYDHQLNKVSWDQIRAKPEDYGYTQKSVEKKTVPGQSQSVKEILERYEKGRPQPAE